MQPFQLVIQFTSIYQIISTLAFLLLIYSSVAYYKTNKKQEQKINELNQVIRLIKKEYLK